MAAVAQDLTGKVAVVTGAGNPGNIGAACAQALAEAGACVVLADLPGAKAAETAASMSGQGLQAASCEVDISDESSVSKLYDFVLGKFKKLDVLVNNAGLIGVPDDRDVMSMNVQTWDRIMAVNARGTMLMCKHAIPRMIAAGGGSIINISSDASVSGSFSPTAYACSKGAINTLTCYIATQYGSRGVRCNALILGLVLNATTGAMPAPLQELFKANFLSGRLGRPQDAAEVVRFLASERSGWITGQTIPVDGGFLAHFPVTTGLAAMMAAMKR